VRERDRWAGRFRWVGGRPRGKRKEGEKRGGPAEGKRAAGIKEKKKKERLGGAEMWALAGLEEEKGRWADEKRGREREIGRGSLRGFLGL
jgi:hypothetical protein